ncbi:hypothetical protein MK163_12500, partial [bacterium]|nr:hypothetical protein [bacterium]
MTKSRQLRRPFAPLDAMHGTKRKWAALFFLIAPPCHTTPQLVLNIPPPKEPRVKIIDLSLTMRTGMRGIAWD